MQSDMVKTGKEEQVMNQVIETMTTRRSVRSYKPDMPDQDVLDEILKAGTYTPREWVDSLPLLWR